MYNNSNLYLYRDLLRSGVMQEAVTPNITAPIKHNYKQFKEISPEANSAICSYGQALLNPNIPRNIRI